MSWVSGINMDLESAYRYCEELTLKRETNFSLGFQFLPSEKRRAIYVVYAFCRFVDDLSDDLGPQDIEGLLSDWQEELIRVYEKGRGSHPIGMALADLVRRIPIPADGFYDLIRGCRQDQIKKTYGTFRELETYCDFVATSIAKVSLPVYGYRDHPDVFPLARALSFAFQLTNILRDVQEDLKRGRCYISEEDLDRFGLSSRTLGQGIDGDRIGALYEYEGKRCELYFQSGIRVLEYLQTESRRCVFVMWDAYHTLLEKILKDPWGAFQSKVCLSREDQERIIRGPKR